VTLSLKPSKSLPTTSKRRLIGAKNLTFSLPSDSRNFAFDHSPLYESVRSSTNIVPHIMTKKRPDDRGTRRFRDLSLIKRDFRFFFPGDLEGVREIHLNTKT